MPVLQEFKDLIEGNARIYMYFREMWDEIPRRAPYNRDPTGKSQIRDYKHMLDVLNHTFSRAPEWTDAAEAAGMVGVPMCAVFDYAMGTPSGHAAFLDPDVNRMLKKVLNEWGKFLKTPKSAEVLGDERGGWFGEVGKKDLMQVANAPLKTDFKFEDMYICSPGEKYYGYKSWDGQSYPVILSPCLGLTVPRLLHPQGARQSSSCRFSRRRLCDRQRLRI
jgi:phosphatidylserine decarboxylase